MNDGTGLRSRFLPPDPTCTGCFGCVNACPAGAVGMSLSDQGFYHPSIDPATCTQCGSCTHHCPVLSSSPASNRPADETKAFAAWTRNDRTRTASSSGGIFTHLARLAIDEGGKVFGAAWEGKWSVSHVMAETEEELTPLRGSKYLQSRVGDAYGRVIRALGENAGPVLFSGLPCQVAALRTFTDDSRLLTVDLACHGVPSLTVFQKYLEHVSGAKRVTGINFRDKRSGWSRFSLAVTFDDGSEHVQTFREDPFMTGFLGNLYSNEPCYRCPFCATPRQGDITLADYWGVARDYRSDLGVSLVLSNNEKGDEWLRRMTRNGDVEMHETAFSETLRGNPRLVDGTREIPPLREAFFRDLTYEDFLSLYDKHIHAVAKGPE
jgi:coenzyme F420-reducing hydrogenase beta subunit